MEHSVHLQSQQVNSLVVSNFNKTYPCKVTSQSKVKENFVTAWNGFTLLSKKLESFLDGTPFKTPLAVFNVLVDIGEVC